jgi:hypothetical protein
VSQGVGALTQSGLLDVLTHFTGMKLDYVRVTVTAEGKHVAVRLQIRDTWQQFFHSLYPGRKISSVYRHNHAGQHVIVQGPDALVDQDEIFVEFGV